MSTPRDPVPARIADAILTALQSVTAGATYHATLADGEGQQEPYNIPEALKPTVLMDTDELEQAVNNRESHRAVYLCVLPWIDEQVEGESADLPRYKLVADVNACIYANKTLGGLANKAQVTGFAFGSDGVVCEITVQYQCVLGDLNTSATMTET